jgi:hypothetical protein
MAAVRKTMNRLPEKDRPEFLRALHEELCEYARARSCSQYQDIRDNPAPITVDDNFVRTTAELLVLGLRQD